MVYTVFRFSAGDSQTVVTDLVCINFYYDWVKRCLKLLDVS